MNDEITNREYFAEVTALAEAVHNVGREGSDYDDTCDPGDVLHELIDGHEWIIYTHYNLQVLRHSLNESALFDEMGPQTWDDMRTMTAQLAWWALLTDVRDTIGRLPEHEDDEPVESV